MFCLKNILHAQAVCQGSLGDPTVTITFGSGTNPGPLPASKTTYTYTPAGCPNAGEYTFGSLVFGCMGNTWHTIVADHTPNDVNGYYMLVNANSQRGTLYKDTVRGLCPLTTYEMSVWVANILKPGGCFSTVPLKPNLTLQVTTLAGAVLGSYITGDLGQDNFLTWKPYGVLFKTPAVLTDIIISIVNNVNPLSDCGDVIALDDIGFRPCGPSISAVVGSTGNNVADVCEGDTTNFTLSGSYSSGFNNPVFQWQFSSNFGNAWTDIAGATGADYSTRPIASGIYYYRLGIAESGNISSLTCRIYSKPVVISINPIPFVQVTNYIFGCYGSPVQLFASGGATYHWTGPNNFVSEEEGPIIPIALFTNQGVYHVTVTSAQGCSDSGMVNLVIYPAAHATIGPDVSICEGQGTNLIAGGGIKYKWTTDFVLANQSITNDSIANPLVLPADTTRYRVTVFNQYGCSDTAFVTVNVWKKPVASAGPDKKTRLGLPVTFSAFATGTDLSYYWTPSTYMTNANSLTPVVNAPASGYFTLHVQSSHGCGEQTDIMYLKVYDKIIIPNAFSPNGDGINDTWFIDPLDLFTDAVLEVFDRSGQVVFKNQGAYKPWNGTRNGIALPTGTYYYILDLKIKNEKPLAGSVTILR